MPIEKFQVHGLWSSGVQFTAEIECEPDASIRLKTGLALLWGVKNGADLSDADLSDANLSGADLRGAVLRGADLRSFKADFFLTLLQAQPEVPALIAALREGRVNGSVYEGECACLVGTLANARGDYYSTNIVIKLSVHHINRRHGMSPDGWALLQTKPLFLIETWDMPDRKAA